MSIFLIVAKRDQKAFNIFGNKIRALRQGKGMTQTELADDASTYRSQIIAIENGTANPTLKTILALAKALNVKPKDLLDF